MERIGLLDHDSIARNGESLDERAEKMGALDEAPTRLSELNPRLARVVECRFFGGLTEREVLAKRRRMHPGGHPDVALSLREVASRLNTPEHPDPKREEAESLYLEALTMQRSLLGPDHPQTITTLNNRAGVRYWKGDLPGAEADLRHVVSSWRQTLGPEHQNTLTAMSALGAVLRDQGKLSEAEPLFRAALAIRRRLFGESHQHVAQSLGNVGRLSHLKGDYAGAERNYRQALAIERKLLHAGHPLIAWRLHGLGEALTALGRARQAEPLLREALEIRIEKLGPDSRLTAVTRRALGMCLASLDRDEEAERMLVESHRALRHRPARRGGECTAGGRVLHRAGPGC